MRGGAPVARLRAVIFDFDGVLADTEPLHFRAFREVAEGEGMELTEEEYAERYLALDDRGFFERLLADRGRPGGRERVEGLMERKARRYAELARGVGLLPGAAELIRALAARFPLAIASGALLREIEGPLERAGLRRCFRAIVSAEQVERGKPHPESFLLALARLNGLPPPPLPPIRPGECLVVEDAAAGVEGARAAGMRCLAVAASCPPERLRVADRVVSHLGEVRAGELAPWFEGLGGEG